MLGTDIGYHHLCRALVEHWWKTTNTFHTPVREWTLTPFEFVVLMGIHFGSRLVDVDPSLLGPDCLADLPGFTPEHDANDSYRNSILREQVSKLSHATEGPDCLCFCFDDSGLHDCACEGDEI
ncbi:hypothetical protein JCGZ_13580 [Jatropha curcas]|uniref:Aminotransferase-like plant mobile domain-containing protein n=1 Tax=Jatropha curcas TaxID=180498 RepID=A0A067KA20_JATCU|nr:hypothetical protein JCGZ_13580 [Jatropha curcas]